MLFHDMADGEIPLTSPAARAAGHVRASDARSPGGGRIALLLPNVSGGGAQRSILELGGALAQRGLAVDLVLSELSGEYVGEIPAGIRVITLQRAPAWRGRIAPLMADPAGWRVLLGSVVLPLKASKRIQYIDDLAAYLRAVQPVALLSALTYTNLQALWARRLAGVNTRIVVSERNTLSVSIREGPHGNAARWRGASKLAHRYYPWADAIVAVSDGAARDLAEIIGVPCADIRRIHNPVVSERMLALAEAPLHHPWFGQDQPVIIAAGRLEPAKDFATLLRAFARLRGRLDARLIVLGTGSLRNSLTALADELGISSEVELAGWADNPFAYLARADLFVLSSRYEGLPGVLIQALACGCPCVATDCPSGPREILANGRYGALVPVGDPDAMAGAMERTLRDRPDRDMLMQRGMAFSVERAADAYVSVLLP